MSKYSYMFDKNIFNPEKAAKVHNKCYTYKEAEALTGKSISALTSIKNANNILDCGRGKIKAELILSVKNTYEDMLSKVGEAEIKHDLSCRQIADIVQKHFDISYHRAYCECQKGFHYKRSYDRFKIGSVLAAIYFSLLKEKYIKE